MLAYITTILWQKNFFFKPQFPFNKFCLRSFVFFFYSQLFKLWKYCMGVPWINGDIYKSCFYSITWCELLPARYSLVIRLLFACYSLVIRLLSACYSLVIRLLFACYSLVIRLLSACYPLVIRLLFACYPLVIRLLFACYSLVILLVIRLLCWWLVHSTSTLLVWACYESFFRTIERELRVRGREHEDSSYSLVIRSLFACYSLVIRLLFARYSRACYSLVIRLLFACYSRYSLVMLVLVHSASTLLLWASYESFFRTIEIE